MSPAVKLLRAFLSLPFGKFAAERYYQVGLLFLILRKYVQELGSHNLKMTGRFAPIILF